MDPEFQKLMTVVLTAGLAIAGAGTVVLFLVFRAFGGPKAGGASHTGLMVALIVFIFLCCLGLFALSY